MMRTHHTLHLHTQRHDVHTSHTALAHRDKVAVPALIGATVSVLVSLYAPLTQAGMNPARDLGPRVFAAMAGWGTVALPGPRGGFWVYVVGPIVGALVGAALYDLVVSKVVRTCCYRGYSQSM